MPLHAYTVTWQPNPNAMFRVATFHATGRDDTSAHRRAWAFMRGIDQAGGRAGYPAYVQACQSWYSPSTQCELFPGHDGMHLCHFGDESGFSEWTDQGALR